MSHILVHTVALIPNVSEREPISLTYIVSNICSIMVSPYVFESNIFREPTRRDLIFKTSRTLLPGYPDHSRSSPPA
jgi:hypothetical protein